MGFFTGTKGKYKQISTLTPAQEKAQSQYVGGAGPAFNSLYDYYGGLMSGTGSDFDAFAAPEMRRFNEQIIPSLSEQFAGMGSGALSSSGFRNSAVSAGADLSERLGAIRAQLRQQGAQGLQSLAQGAMQPTMQNVYQAPQAGFLENVAAPLAGAALNYALPGAGSIFQGATASAGKSSPYGNSGYKYPLTNSYDTMFRVQGMPGGSY